MESIGFLLTGIGLLLTGAGLLLSYRSLKAGHDWNRRQYAMNLINEWGAKTANNRKEVELRLPKIVPELRDRPSFELTRERAHEIYGCETGSDDWNLRFAIVGLLNHLETIATAYKHHVADREMIDDVLRDSIIQWCEALSNFRRVVNDESKQPGWKSLEDTLRKWDTPERCRNPTA